MSNYREYIFTIGESPNTRVYKGLRMPPKPDGFEFGFSIHKELSSLRHHFAEIGVKDKGIKQLCVEALEFLDEKKIIDYWNFVLNNQAATIQANEDGKTKTYVFSDGEMFNDWFSLHPADLMEVMYTCIFENAAPFLPVSLKDLMKNVKQAIKDEEAEAVEDKTESA